MKTTRLMALSREFNADRVKCFVKCIDESEKKPFRTMSCVQIVVETASDRIYGETEILSRTTSAIPKYLFVGYGNRMHKNFVSGAGVTFRQF